MSDATKLRDSALAAIAKARDDTELEAIEVEYLGRRDGKISRQLLSGIAQLDPSQRATLGQEANEAKRAVEAALAARRSEHQASRLADIGETEEIEAEFYERDEDDWTFHRFGMITHWLPVDQVSSIVKISLRAESDEGAGVPLV